MLPIERWAKIYKDSGFFISHENNPPIKEYASKHAELGDEFTIEIHGNASEEVIDNINELGLTLQHFKPLEWNT